MNKSLMTAAVLLLSATLIFSTNLTAAESQAPWTHPEVLQAAVNIGMTDEQQPQFREALTEFLQGFSADVRKLMRANNQTDLPRKIERKRNRRVSNMDKQMSTFLDPTQYAAYEIYRDTLLEKMDDAGGA